MKGTLQNGDGTLCNESLGTVVRIMRKAFGMTLQQLAVKMGTSFGYIAQVESDRINRPGDDIILKLSKVLSFDPDVLFGRIDEVSPAIKKMIAKHPVELTKLVRRESKKLDSIAAG